jgi:hypothetical protein
MVRRSFLGVSEEYRSPIVYDDDMIGVEYANAKWKKYVRFATYPEVTHSCMIKELGIS